VQQAIETGKASAKKIVDKTEEAAEKKVAATAKTESKEAKEEE
jgi:hypothetical protein